MMKTRLAIATTALLATFGCNQGTPGGPGVRHETTTRTTQKTVESQTDPAKLSKTVESHTTSKPVVTDSKEAFSLTVPMLAMSIKQGESKPVTISIRRGKDFNEDVSLRFVSVPVGVTLSPGAPMFRSTDKDIKIEITVASNAEPGEFTVKVLGHPMQNGSDAENEFKLNIVAK